MQRVLVTGASGAGKSTLAAKIAEVTGLPFIPTDPFYWEEDWQPAPENSVVKKADSVTAREEWVLDGNFDDQRHLVWQRADTVIWLDFPRWVIVTRAVRRNLGYLVSREPMWSGNRMTLPRAWSGIRHSFRSVAMKRRQYPGYAAEFPHLRVLRFGSPNQVDAWLRRVARGETEE